MASLTVLRLLMFVLAVPFAHGAAAQDFPPWFDGAASTRANAANAARDGAPADEATRVLLAAGDEPPHVVSAVVDAYNRCDALYDSVRAAVAGVPERASDIVQAAASGLRCPCSGETIWQRSRLEARIRIEQRRDPLLVAPLCGCAATSAEAAVVAAPDRADEVLEAALHAGRRAGGVVDSLGEVGAEQGPALSGATSLVRVPERRCERDAAADDAFELGQLWQAGALRADGLGIRQCEGRPASEAADDDSTSGADLALAGYLAAQNDRVLVLHNATDREVDLAGANYQVELYFPGQREAGRRLPLEGRVAPGAYHVVAGRQAGEAWLSRADQVVPGGLLAPSEAVVLRRGLDRDGCECAVAGVAGTVNGLGPAGKDWLAEQAGAGRQLATADRVGQVRPETFEADQWRSPLAPAPLAIGRVPGECTAERRPEAPFVLGTPWRDLVGGDASAGRCSATPTSVLLASIQAWPANTSDQPPSRSVRLLNATAAPVDLAREGYVLEVYSGGAREPVRVIKLEGELARGASATVASRGAPESERESALAISDDLAQRELDAVVLRRIATGAGGVCRADVYAASVEVGLPPIVIAASADPLAEGEPRSDESPIDPDRGGDLASPN